VLSSGSCYRALITRGTVDKVGAITIRVSFTIGTAATQIVATPYWLDRLVILGSEGGTNHAVLYGDNLMLNLLAATGGSQWSCVSKTINIMGEGSATNLGPTGLLQPGNYTFDIPVVGTFFHTLDYYMSGSSEDLRMELWPAGNIIASGAGTVTVTGMNILVESVALRSSDSKDVALALKTKIAANYLDVVEMRRYNTTLTASAANIFDLNAVRGKCSHALMIVRAAGASNTGSGMSKMYNIGDDASLDIQTSSSMSILGGGTPIQAAYFRGEYWCKSFASSFGCDKPFIVIPMCHNVPKAYTGIMDGFLELSGDSKKLVVNLPAAPTSEVQTFTPSGTAATGYYRFAYKGEMSEPLIYSASVGAMKTALEAMKTIQAKSITVTFSGTIAAGTITGTFVHPETRGMPELVQVITQGLLTSAPAAVSVPTTLTTAGTAGIATGSYDVYLYFYKWRHIEALGGRLASYDL